CPSLLRRGLSPIARRPSTSFQTIRCGDGIRSQAVDGDEHDMSEVRLATFFALARRSLRPDVSRTETALYQYRAEEKRNVPGTPACKRCRRISHNAPFSSLDTYRAWICIRDRMTPRTPSTKKNAKTRSCVRAKGGSDCVGAIAFRKGTFSKD